MKKVLTVLGIMICIAGCYKQHDENVTLQKRVRSGGWDSNIITRPIGTLISFFISEGVKVTNIKEVRTPEGFLQVQVTGFNVSAFTKHFEYRTEWLDANGIIIDSIMSKWMPMSVPAESEFSFKVISPSPNAADYRINTRPVKNISK